MRSASKAEFYNYTLGMPYQDTSYSFFESDVTKHIGDFTKQDNRGDYQKIAVGIDWG